MIQSAGARGAAAVVVLLYAGQIVSTFEAAPGSGQIPAGTEIHLLSVNSELVTTPEGDVELLGVFEMVSPDRTGYPLFVLQ